MAFGTVSVFERDGVYQLYCKAMQEDGMGSLYTAYEELKAKLEKEGYFDSSHKKKIPFMPKSCLLYTSNPFLHKVEKKTSKLKFTDEQQYAYDEISFAMDKNKYGEYLIYGVTGSGKTEIYLQLIENALRNNKTSIMLVPEISLTPQTVDRFIARFGEENIAVLHSKLSIGERFDQWNKIKNGQAKIVIGARSAIFAPIKDLGIIIIDEEHDRCV